MTTDNRFALDAAALIATRIHTAQLQVQQVLIRLGAERGLVGIKRAKA